MPVLTKKIVHEFDFSWINHDYLTDTKGQRIEIYSLQSNKSIPSLILLFHNLFDQYLSSLSVLSVVL